MTLTYWVAQCKNDSEAYNIRRKTKKEVVEAVAADWSPSSYTKPKKVTVVYKDAFELLCDCLGEGGIFEGNRWEDDAPRPMREDPEED